MLKQFRFRWNLNTLTFHTCLDPSNRMQPSVQWINSQSWSWVMNGTWVMSHESATCITVSHEFPTDRNGFGLTTISVWVWILGSHWSIESKHKTMINLWFIIYDNDKIRNMKSRRLTLCTSHRATVTIYQESRITNHELWIATADHIILWIMKHHHHHCWNLIRIIIHSFMITKIIVSTSYQRPINIVQFNIVIMISSHLINPINLIPLS